MGRLDGKVALVTGGAAGIGQATARLLAKEGAKVVIGDLHYNEAKATADEFGGSAYFFDAQRPETIEALINSVIEEHGELHILHNCAALVGPTAWFEDKGVIDTPIELWDRSFETNVRSIFLAVKYAAPHMVKTGNGSIINMASIGGMSGGGALTAYGTTKAAVIGLTRYIAAQFGRQGVRCNAIAPGVIRTQQLLDAVPDLPELAKAGVATPRVGEPEDIANLVLFLASDESAFITGETLRADGGSMATSPVPAPEN
jgi:NAD(P)-dependent dehydrogenase (short-subunit alcohol dehydrogenase family)